MTAHVVASVTFRWKADSQLAPLTCSCGAVMTVSQFPDHRQQRGSYVPKPAPQPFRVREKP